MEEERVVGGNEEGKGSEEGTGREGKEMIHTPT
jgi:hypothetical protein